MTDLETKLAEALREIADWYEERSGDNECRPLENARAALAAYEREKAGQHIHCPSIEVGGYRIPVRIEKP